MIAGYCEVTPLERDEAALLGDLVAARCATAVVVSTWRRSRHADAPAFPGGAVDFLRLLAAEGFDRAGARRAAAAGQAGGWTPRPGYEPRPTPALLAARRRVLGSLGLTYDEPVHLVRGEGVHLFDAEGRRYLDAYNNVPVVGHCHPEVAAAVAAQARRLVTNTRYLTDESVELAERLVERAPAGLDRVLFVNSGSEANDVVWRIARFATGHSGALVTSHAYHGVTEATTDLSPEEWPGGFAPDHVGLLDPPAAKAGEGGHRRVVSALTQAGHAPAALFVDSAFTSDGVRGPATGWLLEAAEAVRAAGGLFVADEVQAGYGRTGEGLWSIGPSGIEPDFMTLGKPMGNGFPVAALLGRADLVDPFVDATGYFSTFGGNTLACAAALAVLDVVERDGLVENAASSGAHLRALLDEVVSRHDAAGELRSWGLLFGLDILGPEGGADAAAATGVANRLRRLGVLVGTTGPGGNVLKIRPPLVFSEADGDELAERLDAALAAS
ncbi:MAG TPA: aminotransferase class III-fold pyridoxal phosphate-dependent enzyme [Acidimicrobiales bacterium]|nr:aminotransferase class III-fold pyridoxal phosphate-dependent enzyme [Acidimicrobiales bacterium]